MQIRKLSPGFSVADTTYPTVAATAGKLVLSFKSSQGALVEFEFNRVPAYRWQEGELPLGTNEPWDGSCEVIGSEWLAQHSPGSMMFAGDSLRHFRFNFSAWGQFEVRCDNFAVKT